MLDFHFSQCTLCPCKFLPGTDFSQERDLLEMVRVLVGVIGEQEKQEYLALKSIALGIPVCILVVISSVQFRRVEGSPGSSTQCFLVLVDL